MDYEEALNKYIQMFGGIDNTIIDCCDDDELLELMLNAIKTGNKIDYDYNPEYDY